ncbi:hypothetical protein ES703_103573 [subsurface metagenome]
MYFFLPNRGIEQGEEAGREEDREASDYKRLINLVISKRENE